MAHPAKIWCKRPVLAASCLEFCAFVRLIPPFPKVSEHAFLVSQKLPIDFDGAENPPFSLPSPEDEIADLCGRLDKSLKIAN